MGVTQRDVPAETWAKLQGTAPTPKAARRAVPLAKPTCDWDGNSLVAVVPVVTASEVNRRDWRARNRRGDAAWRAVSANLGPRLRWLAGFAEWYSVGRALRVTFTRLGGRRLDRGNLPTACKGVEDALAFLLGCNDGDPRWVASWEQEPGGPAGVRVKIERLGG